MRKFLALAALALSAFSVIRVPPPPISTDRPVCVAVDQSHICTPRL